MWAFMSTTEPSVFVRGNEEGVARLRAENGKYAFQHQQHWIRLETGFSTRP